MKMERIATNRTIHRFPRKVMIIFLSMIIQISLLLIMMMIPMVSSQDSRNDGYQPAIYTITPTSGSVVGGTALRIYGSNFQPEGLFSQVLVLIGVSLCHVVGYYTTNEQIYCIVPPCTSDKCISQLDNVYPYETVGVNVYVYTVRGIYNAQTSYTYSYWDTSYISSLTRNMWSTSTGQFTGYMYTDQLSKIDVMFDNYHANLGTNDALNPEYLTFPSSSAELYYYSPYDMPAGYYNSTITLSNPDSQSIRLATGYATFYPDKESKSLYTSTMNGISYLVAIYPMIHDITPKHGSLAGGTVMTITGSGFNNDTSTLRVVVGGVECDITSATIDTITCITGAISSADDIYTSYLSSSEPYLHANLSFGSPGIWFKLYSYNDYITGNDGKGYEVDDHVLLSFPWRQDALLSFWLMYDNYNWPNILNINQIANLPGSSYRFGAQAATIIIAPVSGYYQFYLAVDDVGTLYGSYDDIGINEMIIASCPYYTISYYQYPSQISAPIYLHQNQRYYLRTRYLNGNTQDYFALAVKISPDNTHHINTTTSSTSSSTSSSSSSQDHFSSSYDSSYEWDDILLRHNSVREVQTININYDYIQETQTITIKSAISGNFYLLIQGEALTTALPLSSSISTITSAMTVAVTKYISSDKIQCNSFGGNIKSSSGSRIITITFNCDNTSPYTLLQVYNFALIGYNNMTTSIKRLTTHTPLPVGTFDLNVNGIMMSNLPYDINAVTLRDSINKVDFSNDVMVSYSYSRYRSYKWVVTFVRPRGDVLPMMIDMTGISGPNYTYSITTSINGSIDDIFYDPIPLWMTEIPRVWATGSSSHGSGVEVYQTITSSQDIMKAICDGKDVQGNIGQSFSGQTKGDEMTCTYLYLLNDTSMIYDYHMMKFFAHDDMIPTYNVTIIGDNFYHASSSSSLIKVTIAEQPCIIISSSDSIIICQVQHVPWGEYYPIVDIISSGHASRNTNKTLLFDMMVSSIVPNIGSFAGGQIVTISGYGFHPHDVIVSLSPGGSCIIISSSYDHIICKTSSVPLSSYPTSYPTMIPSSSPSSSPSYEPSSSPTMIDDNAPTPAPTEERDDIPTVSPTEQQPSLYPTSQPTEEIIDDRRRLSSSSLSLSLSMISSYKSSSSSYKSSSLLSSSSPSSSPASSSSSLGHLSYDAMLIIDDQLTSISFTYDSDHTPMISSISPPQLSTAISTTVYIYGTHLLPSSSSSVSSYDNSTIMIGSSSCIIKNITSSYIECYYIRSGSSPIMIVDMMLYVSGYGYAAIDNHHDYSTLPTMMIGYEIYDILPSLVSINGGTTIIISGFGFSYASSKTSIIFADSYGQTTYAQLVQALNLVDNSINQHFLSCIITHIDFNNIICILDHQSSPTIIDSPIIATITLNNYHPYHHHDDNITIIQTVDATPVVTSISSTSSYYDHDDNSTQWTSFSITGTLLLSSSYLTYINVSYPNDMNISCLYDNDTATSTYMMISCQNLPAGDYILSVLVPSYGYATISSSMRVKVSLIINMISYDTSIGSIGGGTSFVITGYGFHPSCDHNMIYSILSRGYMMPSMMTTCTTTMMRGSTPSLVGRYGALNIIAGDMMIGYTDTISSIMISTHGYDASYPSSSSSLFTYSVDIAANIIKFSPINGYASSLLTIIFITSQPTSSYHISIDDTTLSCTYTPLISSSSSYVNVTASCLAPAIIAGSYPLHVNIAPYGHAVMKKSSSSSSSSYASFPSYTSNLRIFNFSSSSSSYRSSTLGGYALTISGQGISSNMSATICGQTCTYLNSSYNTYTCSAPDHITTEYVDALSSNNITVDLISTFDSSSSSYYSIYASHSGVSNAFDNSYYTYYQYSSSSNSECFIGIQTKSSYRIRPYRMRYYPRYQSASGIATHYFEGSTDNGATYTILASASSAKEGWNYLTADDHDTNMLWYTHLRYHSIYDRAGITRHCPLNEIKFLGIIASTIISCPVMIRQGIRSFAPGSVNYSIDHTPMVTSLSPLNGTSLGNTTITIYGTGFVPSSSSSKPVVIINSIPCEVSSYSSSYIICITGYRPSTNIQSNSISILIPDRGYAIIDDRVSYTYLDKWSDLTTWKNQEPPVKGDFVIIPAGQSILLDVDTPEMLFLLIQGQLYMDRTKASLSLDAHYIFIYGGILRIGSEEEPYENKVTITLHGRRYGDIDVPEVGSKALVIASLNLPKASQDTGIHIPAKNIGQLEVHGQKRLRTWTFLKESISSGDMIITLSEKVDFLPGDKLVIAGTSHPGSQPNYGIDEVVVAQNIDGYQLLLTTPIIYDHISIISHIEGHDVDMRCEVGLLSRNIVIQGDDMSDYELFGVHLVARYASILRLENAELRRCGQAFVLGRYCSHSHKAGNMETSYVKANSIHHSYQRAVTTHSTFYWEVRDNVAYHVLGHTYFIEDGNEQYNSFSGNLGIRTIKSSAGISSDSQPAVYWTSNPTNFWYDNHGANSDAHGFWFELPGVPNNYLANGYKLICPVHGALGAFQNNTFHSNSAHGLRIYPMWTPFTGTGCDTTTPAPQYLYNMTSYHNNGNGLFSKRHGDLHHHHLTVIENGGDDVHIVRYQDVIYTHDPAIKHALVVGVLDATSQISGKLALNLPQYEYFYIYDIKVVNYGDSYAIAACNDCNSPNTFHQGGFTTRFEKMSFINSPRRTTWNPHKKEIYHDIDGSLTGVADAMLSKFFAFNNWTSSSSSSSEELIPNNCMIPDDDIYDDAILCTNMSRIRRMSLDNFTPYTLQVTPISIISSAGDDIISYLPRDTSGWVFPLVTGHHYRFAFDVALDSSRSFDLNYAVYDYLQESYMSYNESLIMNYIPNAFDYRAVDFYHTLAGSSYYASKNHTVSYIDAMGSSYYNTSSHQLDMIFSNVGVNYDHKQYGLKLSSEARLCPPAGCPLPPKATLNRYGLWSNASTWIGYGGKPQANTDVIIPAELWVVLDEATPSFNCITIYGRLTFLSGMKHTSLHLKAQCIVVYGSFEINDHVSVSKGVSNSSVYEPYVGNATITIYGSRLDVVPPVLGEGLFLGSKVIAVAGSFVAIGSNITSSHTKISSAIIKGSNKITIISKTLLLWHVNQDITISPTSYFTETGSLWHDDSTTSLSGIERKTISSIIYTKLSTGEYQYTITVKTAFEKTYACITRLSESFCGNVGLLSKNIMFISDDLSGFNVGFGGHIAVVDLLDTNNNAVNIGTLYLDGISFTQFGKQNGDHYAISITHRYHYSYDVSYHTIMNCAFINSYNMGIYIDYGSNVKIYDNIIMGGYAGGIYIGVDAWNVTVKHNLVMGILQNPAVLANGYEWTLPIAAYNFYSFQSYYINNIAAGSYDNGFMVGTSIFSGYDGTQSNPITSTSSLYYRIIEKNLCQTTRGEVPSISSRDISSILDQSLFQNNEAVGCRVGMMIVNRATSESSLSTCAVVSGIKAWRNAHIGIGGIDAYANHYLSNIIVAENHIGISLSYTRVVEGGYSGIINSKIIGTLASKSNENCTGLNPAGTGTSWSQRCQAFASNDPFGSSTSCNSVLKNSLYTRVGILIPQSTNGAKSCAIGGDVPLCTVPTFPNRLCSLPWEKRYGLPSGYQYAEAHFHNLTITGFTGVSSSKCKATYGAALALNPSQIDTNPVIVSSSIIWNGQDLGLMDVKARLGLAISQADSCTANDCMGLKKLIIHDHQAFLKDTADNILPTTSLRQSIAGKIIYDNPEYVSDPQCRAATDLGPNIYTCLDVTVNNVKPYKTYSALWNNAVDASVNVVTGPVTVWRGHSLPGYYNLFNEGSNPTDDMRSYTFFAPQPDFCPDILPTNHFPMLIAPGYYHHAITTGQMPLSWYIRWDSPNDNDTAVFDIYIRESNVVNVFVGSTLEGPYTFMPPIYTTPTLSSPAGTNARNPQSRNMTVTMRGGSMNYYMFRIIPVVAVTIKMEISLSQFFSNTFIANIATLLQIDISRIKIADVRAGSVIVDFSIEPGNAVASSDSDLLSQVADLTTVTNTLISAAASGALAQQLNATISQLSYIAPPTPVIPGMNITNSTTPDTSSSAVNLIGTPTPTRLPTVRPSPAPSFPPTFRPTSDPTIRPTHHPSHPPTPAKSANTQTIIIVACVVTAGVLLLGAIAGYFMTSRAKLTAILPSSNLVITATATDMDLQRWGTSYNQTAEYQLPSLRPTSAGNQPSYHNRNIAQVASAPAYAPVQNIQSHYDPSHHQPHQQPHHINKVAINNPSYITPHQATASGLNIPLNGPAPLPSISHTSSNHAAAHPAGNPLSLPNQGQAKARSPVDRRWATPRSQLNDVKE